MSKIEELLIKHESVRNEGLATLAKLAISKRGAIKHSLDVVSSRISKANDTLKALTTSLLLYITAKNTVSGELAKVKNDAEKKKLQERNANLENKIDRKQGKIKELKQKMSDLKKKHSELQTQLNNTK